MSTVALRLLVVDDGEDFLRALHNVLAGCSRVALTAEARSCDEALNALSSIDVDVIALDLTLGGENGLHVLGRIREVRPSMPVLFLTHHAGHSLARLAIKSGASGYLRKDLVADELVVAIETVAAGRQYNSEACH